jgi:hypothetical protein
MFEAKAAAWPASSLFTYFSQGLTEAILVVDLDPLPPLTDMSLEVVAGETTATGWMIDHDALGRRRPTSTDMSQVRSRVVRLSSPSTLWLIQPKFLTKLASPTLVNGGA